MKPRTWYLHGFASSPKSRKAAVLAELFDGLRVPLECPDLNVPSFERLSLVAMLARLDALYAEDPRPLHIVGSSLGGWLAARYAELHPDRVERLVLLCPGFHLASRWPKIVGEEWFAVWEKEGSLALPDASGARVPMHFGFIEEARAQPPEPLPTCPTLVIHGLRDEQVPIRSSRDFVAHAADARLVEVDDVHDLHRSLDRIAAETLRFFDIGRPTLDGA